VPSGQPISTDSVGPKTFNVSANDLAGNQSSASVTYKVEYAFSGFLPPLEENKGYKEGSAIPVKFQLQDSLNNYISTALAKLYLMDAAGNISPASSKGNANQDNIFRYDLTENQYIFNLHTKGLSAGSWMLIAEIDDGTSQGILILIK